MTALRDAVTAATEGTPYVVGDLDDGFVVRADVADARWNGIASRSGLTSTFSWEVREKGGRYSITDVERRVDWSGGLAGLSASASVRRGRIITKRYEKVWGVDDSGAVKPVVDYRFDSHEGRDLVRACAKRLGMREQLPLSAKVGLGAAAFALLVALVAVAVVLLAAL